MLLSFSLKSIIIVVCEPQEVKSKTRQGQDLGEIGETI